MKNTKYFMMLTLLAVGSMNLQARDETEVVVVQAHRVDNSFLGQMHRIQNEINDVKHEARNCSKAMSDEKLRMIESNIKALDTNPEYKNADMHDHRIRVLNTELKHARSHVKKHGMENGSEVRTQGFDHGL